MSIEKKLFRILLPSQILSSLAMAVCMQIDNIMIGRFIGVTALSAYGLVTPMLFILTAVVGLLSSGITAISARLAGKNDKKGINLNYTSSIVLCFILSLVITTLLLIFASSAAAFLGADQEQGTLAFAADYITGYAVGLPFYFFMQALMTYLQISGKRKRVCISIIAMMTADIVCDVLAGIFGFGMFGMSLASSISEAAAFFIIVGYFLKRGSEYKLAVKDISFKEMLNVIKTGLPMAINQACFTALVFIVNKLLLKYGGTNAVAAYSVISSVSTFCFILSNGVGGATRILAGVFYGEEDKKALRETLEIAIKYVLIMTAAAAVLVAVFSGSIAVLFMGDDKEAAAAASAGLRWYIASIIPCGLTVVYKNLYQGEGHINMANVITAIENLAAPALAILLLSEIFGLVGIWCGFFVGEIVAALFYLIVARVKNNKLSLESCLLLPKDFGVSDDRILDLLIRKKDDVSECSQKAGDFCRTFSEDRSTCYYISLCVEEMAMETILNTTFSPEKNSIFIRLVCRDDMWVLRICDDGELYDAANYAKLSEAEDELKHLGVRMIFRLVQDAKYMNRLGFNTLTLFLGQHRAS